MTSIPAWMTAEYSKRDLSLILFAVRHADEFAAINPDHPLSIHCVALKATVEAATALEEEKEEEQS